MSKFQSWRLIPIQFGILATFSLVPVWLRFKGAPSPFTAEYITGFAIFIPLIWTVGWWVVLGMPGLHKVWNDSRLLRWLLLFSAFIGWGILSTTWAFMRETRPEVGVGLALGWGLAGLFVLVVLCAAPPRSLIVWSLVFTMLLHGLIGGLQVAEQGSIGLQSLGEFDLDPQKSGTSVILSGELRWLRPYGLTSHSNIFAGFMTVGVLAATGLIFSQDRAVRWFGTLAFWFGLWILMLTFSRAAWLGFAVGAVVMIVLLVVHRIIPISTTGAIMRSKRRIRGYRNNIPTPQTPPHSDGEAESSKARRGSAQDDDFSPPLEADLRHVLLTLAGAILLGITFFVLYHPLLLTRAGVGTVEYTESRSIDERNLFNQIALDAIRTEPIHGVGIGNFPWYASHYLFYRTDTGMRGDNVHQVYLYAFSELGIIGFVLFIAVLTLGITIGGRRGVLAGRPYTNVTTSDTPALHAVERGLGGKVSRYALLAGVIALAIIGVFDHYPWSLLHDQVLWWGLLAASLPEP